MTTTLLLLMPDQRNNHVGPASSDSHATRAMEAAWERNRTRLYNMAYQRLRCHDDAQDAMQKANYKLWCSNDQYDAHRPFLPWAMRILNNVCVDMLRRRRRSPEVTFTEYEARSLPDLMAADFADAGPGPEALLLQGELSDEMKAALLELTDGQRECIMLVDVAGCTYDEAAEVLGIPVGTVRTRLHRGRLRMRGRLKGR